MAAMLVSTIPTFSGKLMGERIAREFVLPIFVGAAALVALLVTYPYGTLTLVTLLYLAAIPISYRRFEQKLQEAVPQQASAAAEEALRTPSGDDAPLPQIPAGETKH
jgi:CDP-diacylglycerol--serine O-phosphatidyltransferase